MARSKLLRFKENEVRDNVLQPGKPKIEQVKGKWGLLQFKNDHPINLELACGRGEYSIGLAKEFPNENFVGIDIKGERLWQGSTAALESELYNVAFLRTHILELEKYFAPGEVQNIWIIHPDPRPRDRDEKRRLTYHRFLDIYKRIQGGTGKIHLKTDNTDLFNWTLEEVLPNRTDVTDLHYTYDLKQSELMEEHFGIETKFEKKFEAIGEKIKYLRFEWKA